LRVVRNNRREPIAKAVCEWQTPNQEELQMLEIPHRLGRANQIDWEIRTSLGTSTTDNRTIWRMTMVTGPLSWAGQRAGATGSSPYSTAVSTAAAMTQLAGTRRQIGSGFATCGPINCRSLREPA
jgi:hypothetical protein